MQKRDMIRKIKRFLLQYKENIITASALGAFPFLLQQGDYQTSQEDKTPDYIQKHKKLYTHAKRLVDTATHTHTKAHSTAVDKLLINDRGEVDYERLEEPEYQQKFVDEMSKVHLEKAKEQLKVSDDLNELEQDILMSAYTGVTRGQLLDLVGESGKDLKGAQYLDHARKNYVSALEQNLYGSAASHLNEDHIDDIIKYTGLEDTVKKEKLNVQEARGILRAYEQNEGTLNKNVLKQMGIPRTKLKEDKKKEKK